MSTQVSYQGFLCKTAEFRRSLGVEPDGSVIRIWVDDWKAITFKTLGTKDNPPENYSPLVGLPVGFPATANKEQPTEISSRGSLVFEEDTDNNDGEGQRRTEVSGMHIARVSKSDSARNSGWVTISLVDDRVFWDRGFLDYWRFNIRDDANIIIPSTVYSNMKTVSDLARYLCSRLYGEPELADYPKEWDKENVSFEFAPFERTKAAIKKFTKRYNVEISLLLNGEIGFYKEGTGAIGHGTLNTNELPQAFVQGFGGEGDVDTVSFAQLPERVLIVGGSRYQTAIVTCEPVVMVRGQPVSLYNGLALIDALSKEEAARFSQKELAELIVALDQPKGTGGDEWVNKAKNLSKWLARKSRLEWYHRAQSRVLKKTSKREGSSPALEELDKNAFRLWRIVVGDDLKDLLPVSNQADTLNGKRVPPEAYAETFKKRTGAVRIGRAWSKPVDGKPDTPDWEDPDAPPGATIGKNVLVTVSEKRQRETARLVVAKIDRELSLLRHAFTYRVVSKKTIAIKDLNTLDKSLREVEGLSEVLFTQKGTDSLPGEIELRETLGNVRARQIILARRGLIEEEIATLGDDPWDGVKGGLSRPLVKITPDGRRQLFTGAVEYSYALPLGDSVEFAATLYAALGLLAKPFRERKIPPAAAVELVSEGISQLTFLHALGALEENDKTFADPEAAAQVAKYKSLIAERNKLVPWQGDARKIAGELQSLAKDIKGHSVPVGKAVVLATKIGAALTKKQAWVQNGSFAGLPRVSFYTNEPLTKQSFSMVDTKLGLFRFKKPVGILDRGDVADLGGRRLHQGRVKLVYGARLRPDPGKAMGEDRYERSPEDEFFWALFELKDLADPKKKIQTSNVKYRPPSKDHATTGEPSLPKVSGKGETLVVYRNDLVELITREGKSNREELLAEAWIEATRRVSRLETSVTKRLLYLRPWSVNCNGIISGVRISLRQQGMGIETQVVQGLTSHPFATGNKTRERGVEQFVQPLSYPEKST